MPDDCCDPDGAAYYAAADAIMPTSEGLAEMVRLGAGPPPGWFDDEDWSDLSPTD